MGFSLQQPKMIWLQQFVSKPLLSYTYVTLRHVMSQNCHVYHFTWYFVSMICCCFRLDMYIFSATASLLADKTNECIAISRKNYVIHTCVTRRHMPFHVKMICYLLLSSLKYYCYFSTNINNSSIITEFHW